MPISRGTANVSAADKKKLAGLLAHYAKKAHPFTACYRDQIKAARLAIKKWVAKHPEDELYMLMLGEQLEMMAQSK